MKKLSLVLATFLCAAWAPACATDANDDSFDDSVDENEDVGTAEAAISSQSLQCVRDKDDFRKTGVMSARLEFDTIKGGISVRGVTLRITNPEGNGSNKLFVTPPGGKEFAVSTKISHDQATALSFTPVVVKSGETIKVRMVSNLKFAFDWSCSRKWKA